MKNFLILFIICSIIFLAEKKINFAYSFKNSYFDLKDLESEIKKKEKEISLLEDQISKIKLNLFYLKKLMVYILIKEKNIENSFLTFGKSEDYFNLRKNYLIFSNLYYSFYKDLVKKKKALQQLNELYNKKIAENKRLKELYYKEIAMKEKVNITDSKPIVREDKQKKVLIYDPITRGILQEGKYKNKLQVGTPVYAPLEGVVKKISFFEGILSLTLENNKCYAFLSGFSILNVTLGDRVKAKEKIGEVGFSEDEYNFNYEVFCSSK
mgnify:CR=1 FL=1